MVIFWRMNDIDKGDKNELTAMQIDLWRNLRLQKARIIKWVIYLHNNIRNNSKFPAIWLLVNCGPLRTHSKIIKQFSSRRCESIYSCEVLRQWLNTSHSSSYVSHGLSDWIAVHHF